MTLSRSHPRVKQRWGVLAVAVTILVFAFAASSLATHDIGAFELDKNAADDPAGGADDWNNVYEQISLDSNDTGNDDKCVALGAVECSFVSDPRGLSIFTTGGSKDDLDIPNWQHTDGNVPPKDEILNAYAAKYISTDADSLGDEILYFGADRWAQNGAADFGFWFFRNEIGQTATGFTGVHTGTLATPGDILILGTFTQGGATSNIRVFEWVGTGGNATSNGTVEGPTGAFGDCVPGSDNDSGCGTVNSGLVPVAWPYEPSSGAAGSIPSGGFVEGGINLSDIGLAGCFRSFLAETRSSPSVDAQLKDYVLGSFEACDSTLTTTPTQAAGVSIGGGSVAVTDSATLVVNGSQTWSGTLQFFLCGPITAPATCDTGGVSAGAPAAVNNTTTQPIVSPSLNVTSAGRYCWRGFFDSSTTGVPDDTDSSEGECFVVSPVTPQLNTIAVLNADGDPIPAGHKFPFGQSVFDTATLSGAAKEPGTNGGNATYPSIGATNGEYAGSIQFTLKGPDGGTPACSVTNATGTGTNPQSVSVDSTTGNKLYGPVGYQPGSPGSYHWVAVYTNTDSVNNSSPVTHNADCSDADEAVTVEQIPTNIKTRQSWYPNDTATVSAASGNLVAGGNVAFSLYGNATCTGDAAFTQTVAVPGGSPSAEVSTNNTTFNITTLYTASANSTVTYSWKAVYTPAATDTAHSGKQSACDAERFTITYTNDNGPGTNLP